LQSSNVLDGILLLSKSSIKTSLLVPQEPADDVLLPAKKKRIAEAVESFMVRHIRAQCSSSLQVKEFSVRHFKFWQSCSSRAKIHFTFETV
jgi:hypothetical protein